MSGNISSMEILRATTDAHFVDAATLMRAYRAWRVERYADVRAVIDSDTERTAFEAKLETLADDFRPPRGWLVLGYAAETPVACAGLIRFDADACTLKRMYVADSHRGRGRGRQLAEAIIELAVAERFRVMRLHSGLQQPEAHALYRSLGFTETAPYDDRPPEAAARVVFMELELAATR